MNGAELARQVRARRPELPLIFLTGYAETAALGETDEDHIIRKPFRDGDLIAKIRRVLEAEPAAGREKGLALPPSRPAQSA
jgi:CheY-like chemotaxis protein